MTYDTWEYGYFTEDQLRTAGAYRTDFLHKLSTAYVDNYDTIVIEDSYSLMTEDNQRSGNDPTGSAWGIFIQMVRYKAESAGTEVILVEPEDTQKGCLRCGIEADTQLWQPDHCCPSCGQETSRDHNAPKNILSRGIEKFEAIGKGQAESTPVNTGTTTDTNTDPISRDVPASSVVEAGSSILADNAS